PEQAGNPAQARLRGAPLLAADAGRAGDQPARDAARPANADPDQARRRQRDRLASAARLARSAPALVREELGHARPPRRRFAAGVDRRPRPAAGSRAVRGFDADGAADDAELPLEDVPSRAAPVARVSRLAR